MNNDKATDIFGRIRLFNGDCMEWMKTVPDKYYDLAIVDPPYGLPKDSSNGRGKLKDRAFNRGKIDQLWDHKPDKSYFEELFRISRNQIIWGGNYFDLPPTRCIICWDKCQPWKNFSQIEMAWTSFDMPAKLFRYDNRTGGKIHPTQKPKQLYQWILQNFAKKSDKIFDSYFGSLSIGIACDDMGYSLDACEINEEYYNNAKRALIEHQAQMKLFEKDEQIEEQDLFIK